MQAAPALYGTQEPLNHGPDYFDYFLCVCICLVGTWKIFCILLLILSQNFALFQLRTIPGRRKAGTGE